MSEDMDDDVDDDVSDARGISAGARRVVPWALKWAARWGVPVSWIMSICEIESSYRPGVKNMLAANQGGAWGLMQVTWTTAETLVAKIRKASAASAGKVSQGDMPEHACLFSKWKSGDPTCLLDPELNVMLGSFYLSKFAGEFGKSLALCAVAYHNGAGFLRGFLADKGKRFPDDLPPKAKDYVNRALTAQLQFTDEDKTPPLRKAPR